MKYLHVEIILLEQRLEHTSLLSDRLYCTGEKCHVFDTSLPRSIAQLCVLTHPCDVIVACLCVFTRALDRSATSTGLLKI
jgi:hypothetical protein